MEDKYDSILFKYWFKYLNNRHTHCKKSVVCLFQQKIQYVLQGLLKSLDNAHSLLAKHVETNNKYADSELILQLELDDVKTDCEKYKDELTVQKADVQEKDAKINELRNTINEKVRKTFQSLLNDCGHE